MPTIIALKATPMRIEGAGVETSSPGMEGQMLLRLLTWLSPAFPVGAFSYSHGLETAITGNEINDRASLQDWLDALLTHGSGWTDAILLAQSWQGAGSDETLIEINDLALALAPSEERFFETSQQGAAFLKASRAWPAPLHSRLERLAIEAIALPVIIGAMARDHAIPLATILPASLHAFTANLVSVAIRLVPLGQSDGLAVQASLEPVILDCARRAAQQALPISAPVASTPTSPPCAMKHCRQGFSAHEYATKQWT